ncbi:MAG: sugar transferase [Anaerolineae bacterium]|nr:sugar transferase [Anaerolineae bacterium]
MNSKWRVVLELVFDAVLINLGFVLAYWVRYQLEWPEPVTASNYKSLGAYVPLMITLTGLLLLGYVWQKAYVHSRGRGWLDEMYALFSGTLTGLMLLIVTTYFVPELSYSRGLFPLAAVTIFALLALSRIIKSIVLNHLRRRGIGVRRVLVVGAGEVGRTVIRSIVAHPELGYQVVGLVDDDPEKGQTDLGKIKALGEIEKLPVLISEHSIDLVITALPWMYHRKILRIMRQCEGQKTQVYIVPDLLQTAIRHVDVEYLGEVPVVGVRQSALGQGALFFKRALDLILIVIGLMLGWPVLLLIALLIRIDSPGPAIFAQTRIGKNGVPFTIYKFRTMRQGADSEKAQLMDQNEGEERLFKIKDDPRVTRMGRFLRKTSLDELAQFWNVLRGEMSIVGPRPQVPSEVELYLEWHRPRLDVLPGITGMWQVSGRSELGFDEMALLDIWYVENWTLWLDIKIILKTAAVALAAKGAY